MKPIKYRGHNNYDVQEASDEAVVHNNLPSLTVQAHAEDADINVLMRRYGITGKMPENVKIPTYGDFTHITDYRSALEATRKAHNDFMEIPAEVRARFDNDPQLFLEFASNPQNLPAMVELGLAKARPTQGTGGPTPGPVAPNPGTAPGTGQGGGTAPTVTPST